MVKEQFSYTLSTLIANLPDVQVKGDPACGISGIAPIQQAKEGDITFLSNPSYKKYLASTKATAVILSAAEAIDCTKTAVIAKNPYYVYSQIAHYFKPQETIAPGVHPTAVIGDDCHIDDTASIGPYVVLGVGITIGKGVTIGAHSVLGDHVTVGANSRLDARVTVYHHVSLGQRVHIASGAVIGSDGFGLAPHNGVWHMIPQLGSVHIEDDVAIGANTTIDRGALQDTILEEGVKLDNLIQIGHNAHICKHTVIAGCVAVAGSSKIGQNCMIGGASNIAGHIEIADRVALTGMTAVTKSITEPGVYSSGIVGAVPNHEFRKNNAWFHRLGNLVERVKSVEQMVKQLITKRESL